MTIFVTTGSQLCRIAAGMRKDGLPLNSVDKAVKIADEAYGKLKKK